jgi:hypothetical protein
MILSLPGEMNPGRVARHESDGGFTERHPGLRSGRRQRI